ncbi:hypothetical protein BGZ98_004940, partial [Dissophora globulifera]
MAARIQSSLRLAARLPLTKPLALNNAIPLARRALFSTAPLARFAAPTGEVAFTSEKLPYIKRNDSFAKLSESDLSFFKSVLSPTGILQDEEDLEVFNNDWLRKYRGQSKLVLKPSTTEQVSKILKYCNEHRLAVVPQGGNTGLVGGSVPVFDEIVISMANMNSVRSFDSVSGALVCDAGSILEVLDKYLEERGYIMPLDLGAKGRHVLRTFIF